MVMVSNKSDSCRGRGRPQIRCDEDTLRLIIAAAWQEFLSRGYAHTGMVAVAQKAGISTKTLYRLVPNKAELFKMVVAERIGRFMLGIDCRVVGSVGLAAALGGLFVAFGHLTVQDEGIAMARVVVGEGGRFPGVAQTFFEGAIPRIGQAIADWL